MLFAFTDTVTQEMDTDPRLAVVLADISTPEFADAAARHPGRVVNVGIREQLMIGTACGMALTGLRPVVHTIASFLTQRPYEQIKLLGHQGAAAVLVGYGASYDITEQGRTHFAPEDVALFETLPGWTIHVPGHPDEARQVLLDALRGDDCVYIRLSARVNHQAHPTGGFRTIRQGRAGTVLAVGPTLDTVLRATAHRDVTVLYASTVRPFDEIALRTAVLAADHPDVVLVEPYLAGTSAHHVDRTLVHVPHRLLALGVSRDTELHAYGSPEDHDIAHGLDEAGIARAVAAFLR
ncbi:transketolase family protein [Streptomyces cylindrosporus]|uniref:Transketolase n=1 Tax=Streptomyces cylindrosporus TaxID=2927583 RepID=A0ABS9Y4Z7_9ACTN|nr:transketolase [Streptomyces cylindrosporus]MCI3271751.1 transketolase [Streptomyces cylindrosporus]